MPFRFHSVQRMTTMTNTWVSGKAHNYVSLKKNFLRTSELQFLILLYTKAF